MPATATVLAPSRVISNLPLGVPKSMPKPITWEEFQKKYLEREDGFKYEWVNQQVVKSKHMDYLQFYIVNNIRKFFDRLCAAGKFAGVLMPEGDIRFVGNHRRPDICYLTDEQIARTAYGENQVPQFIIEIISTHDQKNTVAEKMTDYRRAGVQVVWQVFPKLGQIDVYSGERLKQMTVCEMDDLASAAPVLPDFVMPVAEVFLKPPKPE